MDLRAALGWLNSAVISSTGSKLREPERVILKGTWRGLTYEQMADSSEYSTNYLMRDVAPKLWKQLSNVLGRSVGKTNFRVALEAYAATNAAVGSELLGLGDRSGSLRGKSASGFAVAARSTAQREVWTSDRYWPTQAVESLPESGLSSFDRGDRGVDVRSPDDASNVAGTDCARLQTPMYGYKRELARLKSWLMPCENQEPVRAVGIWGLRGMGKTMLAERLVAEVGDAFDYVVCRSLQDKPLPSELCISVLAELGFSGQIAGQAVPYLLAVMASKSVLLLIEDVEAVLEPGQLAGGYLADYQGYENFFLGVVGTRGCVVVTGLEGPAGLVRQGGSEPNDSELDDSEPGDDKNGRQVRSLFLRGLDLAAAVELLRHESLSVQPVSVAAWPELAQRYQGHPMALKATARVIREIFDGRVDKFLAQMSTLSTDVLRLLSLSSNRLCAAELDILYWLASQDSPLSLAALKATLPISLRSSELISALDSLKQRSLLLVQLPSARLRDKNRAEADLPLGSANDVLFAAPTFSLPVLVKAYAIYQFVEQLSKQSDSSISAADSLTDCRLREPMINLGAHLRIPVRLSRWFEGQFGTRWQPLKSLFTAVDCPSIRLRSAYHFRDKAFVKRCKFVVLSTSEPTLTPGDLLAPTDGSSAVLLIAVRLEGENLYKVCVQVQPATDNTVLPKRMELRLLDAQKKVLAAVAAEQDNSFIQLPYFQGMVGDSFEIELALDRAEYREKFVI